MQLDARALSQFSTSEVQKIFDTGRPAFKNNGLTILYAPRLKEYGRLLVITARKVGNAPARNLIRRRLKALFYESAWYLLPYDFIIITRAPATHYSFQKLKQLCTDSIARLSVPPKQ